MKDIVAKAKTYAINAHKRINHRRKYTNKPYDIHLKAVAELVGSVSDDSEMIAAAWLHDIVEDTPLTHGDIENEFGEQIAAYVYQLTDLSRPRDGNRATRKLIDLEHISLASAAGKTIKLADLIDNLKDIAKHDKKFIVVFLNEAVAYLDVLSQGNNVLYSKLKQLLYSLSKKLKIDLQYLKIDTNASVLEKNIHLDEENIHILKDIISSFTAQQILNPLLSHDNETKMMIVLETIKKTSVPVLGVRIHGNIVGYVSSHELGGIKKLDLATKLISRDQIVTSETMLVDIIEILNKHDFCFIQSNHGTILGYISKNCIEKPIVRMWLFGILSLMDSIFQAQIMKSFPNDTWSKLCTKGRLKQAQDLHYERKRIKQDCYLIECLQFSDKAKIIARSNLAHTYFDDMSTAQADRIIRALESLRNNLAHNQLIVTHDWPQIIKMSRNMQNLYYQ